MPKQKPHEIFGIGPLATPMRRRTLGDVFSRGAAEEFIWQLEWYKKWDLLFQHYKLNPRNPDEDIWPKLAIQLALDLVPGFREVRPSTRGRRPAGELGRRAREDLWRMLEEIIENHPVGAGLPRLTTVSVAKRIKRQLDRRPELHFFKSHAVETIRHQLSLACHERQEAENKRQLAARLSGKKRRNLRPEN